MKIEIVKETKPDLNEESGQKTWYWVKLDGVFGEGSRPFHTEEEAIRYYDVMKQFFLNNGSFESVAEIIKCEDLTIPAL